MILKTGLAVNINFVFFFTGGPWSKNTRLQKIQGSGNELLDQKSDNSLHEIFYLLEQVTIQILTNTFLNHHILLIYFKTLNVMFNLGSRMPGCFGIACFQKMLVG